jgi:hypothetical protein
VDTTFSQVLLGNWIVAIVVVTVGAGVVTSIAKQVRKYGCYRQDVELKRDLVERGLAVDEIERIVAAKAARANSEST